MVRIFGHYIPRGLLFLLAIEFVVLFLTVHVATEIRLGEEVSPELYHDFNFKATVFAAVYLVIMVAVGLYQRDTREKFSSITLRLFWSSLFSFWVLSLGFYLFPDIFIGRGVFIISCIIGFVVLTGERFLFNLISNKEFFQSRMLVVGTGQKAKYLQNLRRKTDWRGVNLVGFLHLKGDHDEVEDTGNVIRSEESLVDIVDEFGIDEIVVAVDDNRKNYPVDDMIQLKLNGLKITHISEFFERRSGRVEIEALSPGQVIYFDGFHSNISKEIAKRLFDILISSLFLVVSVPIMMVLWVLIKYESRWREPVIYTQTRVGQQGRPFTIFKFRSMVVDAEKDGPQYAAKNDARVTRIGQIMRKTRLDEIPQMWNVLRGDMSFVGPRPERPQFVEELNEKIPYFNMRHRVKPGITGWAQICYPYGDNDEDAKQKLQYDLYYIKNFSLFLDITILLQTAQVILFQKGSR